MFDFFAGPPRPSAEIYLNKRRLHAVFYISHQRFINKIKDTCFMVAFRNVPSEFATMASEEIRIGKKS